MNDLDPSLSATRDRRWQTVFVGADGVRAGWRLLVFLALVAVLVAAFFPLQSRLTRRFGTDFSAVNVILGETISFAIVLIASAIMGKFERRSFADYGLPFRNALGKEFWSGALWGFAMLSCIIAMMAVSRAYLSGGFALPLWAVIKFGLLWAIAFLMVGLFEEFSFRGYLQLTLTTGLGFWPAAFVTCLVFAGLHLGNPGENWIGAVEIVLIALFLCLALRRTGNLWFAIGWHMAFDWGESFFYSTPNSGIHATGHMLNASLMGSKWLSGGTVGPEASVFDLLVTIAGILLLAKLYPEAKYFVVPPRPRLAPSGLEATRVTEDMVRIRAG
jgi:membrane protease YdiL (CAAX protease family)